MGMLEWAVRSGCGCHRALPYEYTLRPYPSMVVVMCGSGRCLEGLEQGMYRCNIVQAGKRQVKLKSFILS